MEQTNLNQETQTRLIRLSELTGIVGLCRSTIYNRMREGRFPNPVGLGGRLVAWSSKDIEGWINDLKHGDI